MNLQHLPGLPSHDVIQLPCVVLTGEREILSLDHMSEYVLTILLLQSSLVLIQQDLVDSLWFGDDQSWQVAGEFKQLTSHVVDLQDDSIAYLLRVICWEGGIWSEYLLLILLYQSLLAYQYKILLLLSALFTVCLNHGNLLLLLGLLWVLKTLWEDVAIWTLKLSSFLVVIVIVYLDCADSWLLFFQTFSNKSLLSFFFSYFFLLDITYLLWLGYLLLRSLAHPLLPISV
jgi:hypothetical protein